MGNRGLQIRIAEGAWIDVDDIPSLPTEPHQRIFIEPALFKTAMGIRKVAEEVGVSVRELRRMLATGEFPPSNLRRGQFHFWARETVRSWKRDQPRFTPRRSRRTRLGRPIWKNVDQIETREGVEADRKHHDTKKLVREVRLMNTLAREDPETFAKQHPRLREWLATRGPVRTGKS